MFDKFDTGGSGGLDEHTHTHTHIHTHRHTHTHPHTHTSTYAAQSLLDRDRLPAKILPKKEISSLCQVLYKMTIQPTFGKFSKLGIMSKLMERATSKNSEKSAFHSIYCG